MCVEELFPEFQPYVAYFVEICHRLYSKGLVCAYDGNVSMKIGEHILITPTHVCKGDLSVSDLLVVNGAGEKLYGKRQPSSEMKVHLAVYNRTSGIYNGCVSSRKKCGCFSFNRI